MNAKTFGNWLRIYRNGREVIRSSELVPVTIKRMSMPANMLRLIGQGDYVLELPPTVSPYWLEELLNCL